MFRTRQVLVVTLGFASLGMVFNLFALLSRIICYLSQRKTCEALALFDLLIVGFLFLFTTFPLLNISLVWLDIADRAEKFMMTPSNSRYRKALICYYFITSISVLVLFGTRLSYFAWFIIVPAIWFIIFVYLAGYFRLRRLLRLRDPNLHLLYLEMKKATVIIVSSTITLLVCCTVLMFTPPTPVNPFFNLSSLMMTILSCSSAVSSTTVIWYCWKQVQKRRFAKLPVGFAISSPESTKPVARIVKEIFIIQVGEENEKTKSFFNGITSSYPGSSQYRVLKASGDLKNSLNEISSSDGVVVVRNHQLFTNPTCLLQLFTALNRNVPITVVDLENTEQNAGVTTAEQTKEELEANHIMDENVHMTVQGIEKEVLRNLNVEPVILQQKLKEFFSKINEEGIRKIEPDFLKHEDLIKCLFDDKKKSESNDIYNCWQGLKLNRKGYITLLLFLVIICSLSYTVLGLVLRSSQQPSPFALLGQTNSPIFSPTTSPSNKPTKLSSSPSPYPTTLNPTYQPSVMISIAPSTTMPSKIPSSSPTKLPSISPSWVPSASPTIFPTFSIIPLGNKLIGNNYVGSKNIFEGASVSISGDGNTAAIGGYGDNGYVGAVWVFARNSSNLFVQQGSKLVGSSYMSGPSQGSEVAISFDGSTIVSGGPGDDDYIGATWVFTRNRSMLWNQQGPKLVGSGYSGKSRQGWGVSINSDGSTILVGGYSDNKNTGAGWIFVWNGTEWVQDGSKLVASGTTTNSQVGNSVALSGDGNTAILAGNGDSNNIGALWVFKRNASTGIWMQFSSKLVGSGYVITPGSGVWQGVGVTVNYDGNIIVTGGPYDNYFTGAAWVFMMNSTSGL